MLRNACKTGLIEAADLARLLKEDNESIRLIDASYAVPGGTAASKAAFEKDHLPGAVFFDTDAIADRSSDLPHMLPSAAEFARTVESLGIGSNDTVVVYDQTGIALAAARAWWMFRVFGQDRVCVLNGGLPAWRKAGQPLESGQANPASPARFEARYRPDLVRGAADMAAQGMTVIDARSAERYAGLVPEPRPGLRQGHIPGSLNIPFASLIGADGRLLDGPDLAKRLTVPSTDPVAVYCGSGLTACVPALAFFVIGKQNVSVYDGSWAEWGQESGHRAIEL
jgi:thiosulfate/3-mercaptopyruvate sulfurtransferase